ncbi:hypothetical protein BD560DRAFT_175047 [Blakeslea trispora]|nr:hypothetical protein BD560DRAFT_175047 [Blakeslea trispora]
MFGLKSLLFWIEQEPVESEAEVFLPADTPVHRPSPKVSHQIQKIKQKRLLRESKRLKTAYYERLKDRKRERASKVEKSKLPTVISAPNKVDFMTGNDFISQNEKQIVELLELARSIKSNPSFQSAEKERDKEKSQEKAEEEPVKLAYQKHIENEWLSEIKGMQTEYSALVTSLFKEEPRSNKQSTEEPRPNKQLTESEESPIHISHINPLPPRVSHKDPRTFLPEYRKRP